MKFQSTPPRGRRPVGAYPSAKWMTFQSTPPRGRRQTFAPLVTLAICCFNPRLRAGGDSDYEGVLGAIESFNPRLAREATP